MRLWAWGLAITLVAQSASASPPDEGPADGPTDVVTPIYSLVQSPQRPQQDDPAEALYRDGISDLNDGSPGLAAGKFQTLVERYPKSKYAPEALYWRAFALARKGERDNTVGEFQEGLAAIREMRRKFRKAYARGDGPALEQRILGQLAQRGDSEAIAAVTQQGDSVANAPNTNGNCEINTGPESSDVQIAALNALTRMGSAQAFPTLQKILRQRDNGSVCLRRAAVLIAAQQRADGTEALLLNAARNDPDLEVRKRAVLYLSQFTTDQAMSALDSIVRETRDTALASTAVVALSQSPDARAREALARYAERDDVPKAVQRQAIQELLRKNDAATVPFLQRIYRRLDTKDAGLRTEILQRVFDASPFSDSAAGRWYFGIARDNSEAPDVRIEALRKGAHMAPIQNRMKIYAPTLDRERRARLIDAYASNEHVQQDHDVVLEDLADIARREPDSELRLKALNLISSSSNRRAAQILSDIVTHP